MQQEAQTPDQTSRPSLGEGIAEMYDQAIAQGVPPLEFHIFDPQLAESLDLDWLKAQVEPDQRDHLNKLVDDGVVRTWPTNGGRPGFTLFSHEEYKFCQELEATGLYDKNEIKHRLVCLHRDIDGTLEILP